MSLKPGESRVLREVPCPTHMLSHPNEYWLLRRAGNRLMENFNYWDFAAWRNYQDALVILKSLSDAMPTHPCRAWTQNKLGFVFEICCPNCETVFEWEGKFYAPRCPTCARWLTERRSKQEHIVEGQGPVAANAKATES